MNAERPAPRPEFEDFGRQIDSFERKSLSVRGLRQFDAGGSRIFELPSIQPQPEG
jgi:hypothetical protein